MHKHRQNNPAETTKVNLIKLSADVHKRDFTSCRQVGEQNFSRCKFSRRSKSRRTRRKRCPRAELYTIWNDGINLPVFYTSGGQGALGFPWSINRSNYGLPANRGTWNTAAFNIPAVGSTVVVTVNDATQREHLSCRNGWVPVRLPCPLNWLNAGRRFARNICGNGPRCQGLFGWATGAPPLPVPVVRGGGGPAHDFSVGERDGAGVGAEGGLGVSCPVQVNGGR